ncbi:MAG: dynamin family protein [Treponema sp.]|nr:dynamin family protein [Treponema sp.]
MLNENKLEELKSEFVGISERIDDGLILEDSRKTWKELHDKIERRFNVFKSDKLFVVATGMLKAGKSTLVNLLARSTFASPIGFGVDTTRRPALIMASKGKEKAGIYIYFPKLNDSAASGTEETREKQRQLENIIDRISGLKDWDDEYPKATPCELNQENLRAVLCEPASGGRLTREPLLVVVIVPDDENSLLTSQNCAIFDMPGLDSPNAEIDAEPAPDSPNTEDNIETYTKIFQECSLLLFVQSNVSPLNNTACKCLRKIGSKLDKNSYRLVQNRMDARDWRKKDVVEGELKEQLVKGKEDFTVRLNVTGVNRNNLPSDTANLGMAYDAVFNGASLEPMAGILEEDLRDELLDKSGYGLLEANLRDDIKDNGKDKHNRQCIKQLDNELSGAISEIGKAITGRLDSDIRRLNEEIDSLVKEQNRIAGYNSRYTENSFSTTELYLSRRLDSEIEECVRKEFEETKNRSAFEKLLAKQRKGSGVKLDEYNRFLSFFSEAARDSVSLLLGDVKFDDVEYKVLTSCGEEERRRSVLELMNDKIGEMKKEDPELCNPIINFPPRSESLRDFLPQDAGGKLEPSRHARKHSGTGLFKSWEKVSDEGMAADCERIVAHYQNQVRILFNKIIKGMMTDKLNRHNEECLKPVAVEKQNELGKKKDALEKLLSDRARFKALRDELAGLEGKIGGLSV